MNPWVLLVARYGIPTARLIWEAFKDNTEPTKEMWDALETLVEKSKEQYIEEAKIRLGIPSGT